MFFRNHTQHKQYSAQQSKISGLGEEIRTIIRANRGETARVQKAQKVRQEYRDLRRILSIDGERKYREERHLGEKRQINSMFVDYRLGGGTVKWQLPARHISMQGVGQDPSTQTGFLMEVDIYNRYRNPQDAWHGIECGNGFNGEGYVTKQNDKIYIGPFDKEEGGKLFNEMVTVCRLKENNKIFCVDASPTVIGKVCHHEISLTISGNKMDHPTVWQRDFVASESLLNIQNFIQSNQYVVSENNIPQIYSLTFGEGIYRPIAVAIRLSLRSKIGIIQLSRMNRRFYCWVVYYLNTLELSKLRGYVWMLEVVKKVSLTHKQRKIAAGSANFLGGIQRRRISLKSTRKFERKVKYERVPLKQVVDYYKFQTL